MNGSQLTSCDAPPSTPFIAPSPPSPPKPPDLLPPDALAAGEKVNVIASDIVTADDTLRTTGPTPQDLNNAARRDAIAVRMEAEYQQVLAWADRIMGPGWYPAGRHYLLDKENEDRCRRTGERPSPAATVYSVTNGASRRHFTIRDGQPVEVNGYQEAFGDMLLEPHPTMRIEVRGQMVAPHRYSLCWASIETYRPRSAEELAEARARRQQRAVEKAAQENPLFADQIRSGQVQPRKKRRER